MTPDTIIERLSALYGKFEQTPRYNALDELIFTVLTQHTSDLNAERAFDRLREEIPTWEEVMVADQKAIADAIFPWWHVEPEIEADQGHPLRHTCNAMAS